ncbi:MAG: ABC transporter permease/substrate-binding protein [Caulobacterales bacterium]|nr:ABC transporter permease/substrate-binding protein [Caulobacterales bacterium]
MSEAYGEALARLPALLSGHVVLSLLALLAGLAVSLPIGVFAARRPRAQAVATAAASVIQTVPSIALLALMVPILGGVIGFRPAFAALTLYSILPVLRNTVVGLAGVPDPVREAGRAAGMTDRQLFFQVEMPLALPTIVAGVRTSAVWVVGTATLATPVGATSLGDLIFAGLQTRVWEFVIVGCISAAGLAIVLDQVLRLAEIYAQRRDRATGAASAAGFLAILAAAFAPVMAASNAGGGGGGPAFADASQSPAATLAGRTVRIGSKTFTEQFILARLIAARVEADGGEVELVENLGSTIAFDALVSGEIDVYVDYTGTLWATVLKREDAAPRAVVSAETAARLWRERGVLTLGELGFENAYAFAMRADRAEALAARTIADLTARAGGLSIGSDPEFFARAEWTRTRDAYGLGAMTMRSLESTFMYPAARDGQVDVITAYTTDARIDAFGLALLSDPAGTLPPYDAVLLVSPEAARDRALAAALKPLVGRISPDLMRAANGRVDLDGQSPDAAAAWLEAEMFAGGEG